MPDPAGAAGESTIDNAEGRSLHFRPMSTRFFTYAALAGILALAGCDTFSVKPISLWTDRAEVLVYAELFNSRQDSYRVEIGFQENPSQALDKNPAGADIVIGPHLASPYSIHRFRSLESVFDPKAVQKTDFYPGLLALGRRENQQLLFPVSFNLPIIVFDARYTGDFATSFSLDLEDLRRYSVQFNRERNKSWVNVGFSPLWDPGFILHICAAFNADFGEDVKRNLDWNERNLSEALSFLRSWMETGNGGYERDSAFAEKYVYDPPYKLLTAGRIRFGYAGSSDFMLLPEGWRSALDYRWLSHQGRITAVDNIIYAGVPLNARNAAGAESFLRWLFNPQTQKELLESTKAKIPYSFGLVSGFSSLPIVNEKDLPVLYPALMAHVPPRDLLAFPPPTPSRWRRLATDVLKPYLIRRLTDKTEQDSLKARYSAWSQNQIE